MGRVPPTPRNRRSPRARPVGAKPPVVLKRKRAKVVEAVAGVVLGTMKLRVFGPAARGTLVKICSPESSQWAIGSATALLA